MWVFCLNCLFSHTYNIDFVIDKSTSTEHRESLRESFVKLFGGKDVSTAEQVQSKLSEKIPATLYPLKTYTDLVRPLIKNSLVQSVLQQSFRSKRTLPYIYDDGSTLHDSVKFTEHIAFNHRNVYDFFENHMSNDLAHLIDLAAILTRADLRRYSAYITEAEMKKPVRKKLVTKRSRSPSDNFYDD